MNRTVNSGSKLARREDHQHEALGALKRQATEAANVALDAVLPPCKRDEATMAGLAARMGAMASALERCVDAGWFPHSDGTAKVRLGSPQGRLGETTSEKEVDALFASLAHECLTLVETCVRAKQDSLAGRHAGLDANNARRAVTTFGKIAAIATALTQAGVIGPKDIAEGYAE